MTHMGPGQVGSCCRVSSSIRQHVRYRLSLPRPCADSQRMRNGMTLWPTPRVSFIGNPLQNPDSVIPYLSQRVLDGSNDRTAFRLDRQAAPRWTTSRWRWNLREREMASRTLPKNGPLDTGNKDLPYPRLNENFEPHPDLGSRGTSCSVASFGGTSLLDVVVTLWQRECR